jgi:hypothetical protein
MRFSNFIKIIKNKIQKTDLSLQDNASKSFKELGEDWINFSWLLVKIAGVSILILPFILQSLYEWNFKLTFSLLVTIYFTWPMQWIVLSIIFKIKQAFQYFFLGLLAVILLGFFPKLSVMLEPSLTKSFTQVLSLEPLQYGLFNLRIFITWGLIVIPSFLLLALAKFPLVWISIKFKELGYQLRVGEKVNLLQAILLIYVIPFLILKIIHYFLEPFGLFKFII